MVGGQFEVVKSSFGKKGLPLPLGGMWFGLWTL
jgi:hypothetical protein